MDTRVKPEYDKWMISFRDGFDLFMAGSFLQFRFWLLIFIPFWAGWVNWIPARGTQGGQISRALLCGYKSRDDIKVKGQDDKVRGQG
ncbi:MAG: hypothetical protein A2297_01650 [Elusimicrobia bacterium RIFOXYB2_FULL_48_7]|nr:MAG: hypothetical protein A2297_01650 [Elusimicrobia bacterium RIFOXYB2_FULL_48_7]